jgi:hypothetical protein
MNCWELDSVEDEKLFAPAWSWVDCALANEAARKIAVPRKLTRRTGDIEQGKDMSEPQGTN